MIFRWYYGAGAGAAVLAAVLAVALSGLPAGEPDNATVAVPDQEEPEAVPATAAKHNLPTEPEPFVAPPGMDNMENARQYAMEKGVPEDRLKFAGTPDEIVNLVAQYEYEQDRDDRIAVIERNLQEYEEWLVREYMKQYAAPDKEQ